MENKKIMKFLVRSRAMVEKENTFTEPHVIISIYSDDLPNPIFNKYTKSWSASKFDDLDREPVSLSAIAYFGRKINLFSPWQAHGIAGFIETFKDVAKTVVIHCEAGISRSAGLAAALSKYYNGNDFDYFNDKYMRPNMLVYRTMLNELEERKRK